MLYYKKFGFAWFVETALNQVKKFSGGMKQWKEEELSGLALNRVMASLKGKAEKMYLFTFKQ